MIAAAANVIGEDEFVVIGSQAILGSYPDAPESMLRSMEADIYRLAALHTPTKSTGRWAMDRTSTAPSATTRTASDLRPPRRRRAGSDGWYGCRCRRDARQTACRSRCVWSRTTSYWPNAWPVATVTGSSRARLCAPDSSTLMSFCDESRGCRSLPTSGRTSVGCSKRSSARSRVRGRRGSPRAHSARAVVGLPNGVVHCRYGPHGATCRRR